MSVPATSVPPNSLGGDLGWTLGVLFRAYLKAADAVTAELPGGPRGRQILTCAVRDEPRSQSALAQLLGVDRTVMTYLLDDLVDAGLVERRPDPSDRRSRLIVATEHGRAVLDNLDHRLGQVEEHLLGGLDDDERDRLRTLLQHVATSINAADPVSDTCEVVQDIGVTSARKHPY
ncbi:MarR family winged helix-turn-helix transcriptional regulator [Haloactinopolyspora alba]|uniref:MarR family winged helix-turn-helix transcriptional regulator n=1 Tax=Haloactinopolyspora alba TaxID=648780 RepID=UPI00197AFBD3|nr:MarR family transcriptional regulator [Haloactinopolyspora alba]